MISVNLDFLPSSYDFLPKNKFSSGELKSDLEFLIES